MNWFQPGDRKLCCSADITNLESKKYCWRLIIYTFTLKDSVCVYFEVYEVTSEQEAALCVDPEGFPFNLTM